MIHIQGYKSLASLKLEHIDPFVIIAGSNGAGKSNLVDALAFFGAVVEYGAKKAIDLFGGYTQIHCFKLGKPRSTTVQFEIKISLESVLYHYQLKLHDIDKEPQFSESLLIDGIEFIKRNKGKPPSLKTSDNADQLNSIRLPSDMSALIFFSDNNADLYEFLTNIRVFRFDPIGAKESDVFNTSSSELNTHGRNVATMLSVLEKDLNFREQVLEWIELIVPSMEKRRVVWMVGLF